MFDNVLLRRLHVPLVQKPTTKKMHQIHKQYNVKICLLHHIHIHSLNLGGWKSNLVIHTFPLFISELQF